jgi:hypothetical protein
VVFVRNSDRLSLLGEHMKRETIMPGTDGSIMRKAVNIALNRLGEEMFEVLAYQLRRSYAITFDPTDDTQFSLEQLHFALCVMLGEGSANNVHRQVVDEIRELLQYPSSVHDCLGTASPLVEKA